MSYLGNKPSDVFPTSFTVTNATVEGAFTSQGIDDNADATAITIDSSENVGIGTSSPSFESGTGGGLEINNSSGNGSHIKLTDSASGSGGTNGFDLYAFNTSGYIENYEAGSIVFRNNGSERMRILSSGGITFNGDTATANALDDYEEGTWTPTIIGASSGTKTAGSGNVGRYVVVGNHCTISGTVHCDGTETLSGAIAMGGLPFAVANISSYRIGCTLGGTTGLGMPSGYQSGFAMGADPGNSFVYILARSTTGFSHNPTVANVTNLYGINMTYQIS